MDSREVSLDKHFHFERLPTLKSSPASKWTAARIKPFKIQLLPSITIRIFKSAKISATGPSATLKFLEVRNHPLLTRICTYWCRQGTNYTKTPTKVNQHPRACSSGLTVTSCAESDHLQALKSTVLAMICTHIWEGNKIRLHSPLILPPHVSLPEAKEAKRYSKLTDL